MTSGILATARSGARSVGIAFLDCFLPRFCAVCRARLGTGGHLCADCANLLRPEPFSYCPLCRFEDEDVRPAGRPQEVGCPVHAGVRGVAGMHVREPVLQLTHRLKYSGERWLAGTLADLMPDPGEFDAGHQKYDLMCPVPLHRTRLRERGFNQSAELAAQRGAQQKCDTGGRPGDDRFHGLGVHRGPEIGRSRRHSRPHGGGVSGHVPSTRSPWRHERGTTVNDWYRS